ncbi:MAG: hypothetical protein PUC59_01425 [Firmicutes bacterium]|nr:hypothetical protein [Bacillota bacterium]
MQERIIFLRLFCSEEPDQKDAVFLEARRAFFADPQGDGGRVLRKEIETDGIGVSCQYRFSGKKPVWIVREGRRIVQKLVCSRDGSYAVLTFDEKGEIAREEQYSAADGWIGVTDYREGVLSAHAQPGGENSLLVQQIISEDRSVRNLKLTACPAVNWNDPEALQAVTREFGLPQAVAFTQSGALCYYEEQLAQQANRFALRRSAQATYVAAQMKTGEESAEPLLPSAEELFSDVQQQSRAGQPKDPEEQPETLPPLEELFSEQPGQAAAPEPLTQQPEVERRVFEDEKNSLLLEFSRDGTQVYAGGVRAGERNGFGVGADLRNRSAFAGVWLYGGRCGVMTGQSDDGTVRVRFEDSASQDPELPEGENCVFGADGELLFAGHMTGEQRSGFGMARWGAEGHRYVGMWQDDLPDGRGMELDEHGALLYEGEWKAGERSGFGTAFEEGKPVYTGGWSGGVHSGEGTLSLKNGHRLVSSAGSGFAAEYDETGAKVYEGGWSNGVRCGKGSLFLPSGERIDGQFENGVLTGTAVQYSAAGMMLYRGAFADGARQGRGTLYENGEAVYEGDFVRNRFHGSGKQLENGAVVYVGAFAEGARCGVGASFREGRPAYFGQWKNGVRHGCGVEYRGGEPVFAGCFEDGAQNGRVNEYRGGKLLREMICKNGEPVYMLEYNGCGEPEYIGAAECGERSGMGRLLGKHCECIAQGIFSKGRLVQPVPVLVQELEELECPPELRGSTYETLAAPEQHCVVERPFDGGVYSGHWRGGKPQGDGTLLFADHCCTGNFAEGKLCGKGRLYLSSGKTVEGVFAAQGGERVVCGGREYFVTEQADKENG